MSVGAGRIFESVCLIVCLSVCLFFLSITQTNDPNVFKLGVGNPKVFVYLEVVLFWGSKVKGQGHMVNNTTQ